jgi:serine phosphatase RsbU (regulator of sigma subunit)
VHEKLGNAEKSAEFFSLYSAISRKIQSDEMRQRETEVKKIVDKAESKVSAVEKAKQHTEEELLDKQKTLNETVESLEHIEQVSKERQMQIDLLSKEKELSKAIINNQKLVRNVFLFIIFVVLSFAILFFYNLKVKKTANARLSTQNKEIADQKNLIEHANKDLEDAFNKIEKQNRDTNSSINYAQRIQQALFPDPEHLSDIIPDSFILLNPRDIVSGDFYWFAGYGSRNSLKENHQKNFIHLHNQSETDNGFIISAVDCTGHGIPGAFMSMIGFNLLETIARNGVVKPDEMLNTLHSYIRHLLKQKTTDNRDGMDMTICSVVDKGRKVLFSGAKNPLIFIANGELNYLQGDPYPIGGMQKEEKRKFTLHSINVKEPTSFYIFSDGYTDQFGGIHGQKFGTKSLKELLLEIHNLPMAEQKDILNQRMKKWIGPERKQIDDIIIIGFRVGEGIIDI